jgi:gluconokinase
MPRTPFRQHAMTEPRIVAVDIGTSSTRALLFEGARFTGESAQVEYGFESPEPGAAQLDAEAVFAATCDCLSRLARQSGGRVDGVSLSSAMHSLLAVDADGKPLTPVFTWADNRAAPQAAALKTTADAHALYAETGVPIHPMSPLAKLLWLRETRPEIYARAARFVSVKETVCHRLFGRWVVDDGIASASGLYALRERAWSARALAAAGIDATRLSAVTHPMALLRGCPPTVVPGLSSDTPFVLGGSDGCLANLGAGLIARGHGEAQRRRAVLTIGTSGALRMAVDRATPDAAMRTFCYALADGEFVIGGATNGGGLPLRWLRDNFPQWREGQESAGDPYDALTAMAATVPPGAGGVLFHPYLAGERAPLWNADARASFVGMDFSHGPAHMVRAVMEGVLFNLAMVLAVLEDLAGGPVEEIVAGGGFARSEVWVGMAADLLGRPLVLAENPETTAQGAALLALVALGRAGSLADAVARLPAPARRVLPDPARHARYAVLAPVFAALPDKIRDLYAHLAACRCALP